MNRFFAFMLLLMPVLARAQSFKEGGSARVRLNTYPLFPAPPVIVWPGIAGTDTVVNSNQFTLRACLRNFAPSGDTLNVLLNRQNLPLERTLKLGKEKSPCGDGFFYTRSIPLREGPNVVQLTATNAGGKTTSTLTVKYYKPERRIALVIGNAAYRSKDAVLTNPVNDAKAMATTLQKLGFTVVLKTDVNQRDMAIEINRFADQLGNYQIGLFYYAGHGLQIDGYNYLVPVDAIPEGREVDKSEIKATCVPVSNLFDQLDRTDVQAKIIILDACRNNPFEGTRSRSLGGDEGLAKVNSPSGSLIAYSTSPGKRASDGDGQNGLYTKVLLETMQQPNLPLELMFKTVAQKVFEASNKNQLPWSDTSLLGDFYFVRR